MRRCAPVHGVAVPAKSSVLAYAHCSADARLASRERPHAYGIAAVTGPPADDGGARTDRHGVQPATVRPPAILADRAEAGRSGPGLWLGVELLSCTQGRRSSASSRLDAGAAGPAGADHAHRPGTERGMDLGM